MNPTPPPLPNTRTSSAAVWSLILGALGMAFCLPSAAGIICAIVALIQIERSKGVLRGTGLAIAGLLVSVFSGFISFAVMASIFVPAIARTRSESNGKSLAEARRGFVTQLSRQEQTGFPVPEPPAGELKLIHYRSPVGELPAYLSPIPNDGRKHPAIIWLTGGFSNSISEAAWESAPPANDQSARIFRQAGVVTLYPSLRGGNESPGFHETFFGEVDDVLAAADFLQGQPGIDRIYIGGHSTGGTLALLVAEMSPRFRAVFAFGPVAHIAGYGNEVLTFDATVAKEQRLRDPITWLHGIKSPTYIFEGEDEPSNIGSLRELRAATSNRLVQFHPIKGKDHFSIIAPFSRSIANQIHADTGATPNFRFPQE
jgi:alpha/beta superfamily hydrolase